MVNIRVLLVAIDFTEVSSRVMAYAHHLAAAWQARMLVVHVVHDLSYFTGIYLAATPLPELQQRLETEAGERLEAFCHAELDDGVSYETLVVTGRPIAELHRLIRAHDVDCLVIGSHSTDKPEHQLFGSTVERLLQHAACPVFVIPPQRSSEIVSHG